MIETHNYSTDTATVVTSTDSGLRIDTLLLGNACVNALNYSLINITSGVGNGFLLLIIIILCGIYCGKNYFKCDRKPR